MEYRKLRFARLIARRKVGSKRRVNVDEAVYTPNELPHIRCKVIEQEHEHLLVTEVLLEACQVLMIKSEFNLRASPPCAFVANESGEGVFTTEIADATQEAVVRVEPVDGVAK